MPNGSCDRCRFWDIDRVSAYRLVDSPGSVRGLCRVNPPQVIDGAGEWPTTFSTDWCGACSNPGAVVEVSSHVEALLKERAE